MDKNEKLSLNVTKQQTLFDDLDIEEQNIILKELDEIAMNVNNQLTEKFENYLCKNLNN